MNAINDGDVKIQFRLNPEDQQQFETESLWARVVGPNTFQVMNSPFFVFGVSANDIISASVVDGMLTFQQVISRLGHSTYRVFLQGDRTINDSSFKTYWQPISALGGTFENANNHFVSVDIPPGKDVVEIYKNLERGEQDGVWIFEEGHYAGKE